MVGFLILQHFPNIFTLNIFEWVIWIVEWKMDRIYFVAKHCNSKHCLFTMSSLIWPARRRRIPRFTLITWSDDRLSLIKWSDECPSLMSLSNDFLLLGSGSSYCLLLISKILSCDFCWKKKIWKGKNSFLFCFPSYKLQRSFVSLKEK